MKTLIATLAGLAILAGTSPVLAAKDQMMEHQIRKAQQQREVKSAPQKKDLRMLQLRHPKLA